MIHTWSTRRVHPNCSTLIRPTSTFSKKERILHRCQRNWHEQDVKSTGASILIPPHHHHHRRRRYFVVMSGNTPTSIRIRTRMHNQNRLDVAKPFPHRSSICLRNKFHRNWRPYPKSPSTPKITTNGTRSRRQKYASASPMRLWVSVLCNCVW